jgi:hypothetical protein
MTTRVRTSSSRKTGGTLPKRFQPPNVRAWRPEKRNFTLMGQPYHGKSRSVNCSQNLRRAMIYEFLIRRCLCLYEGTADAVCKEWGLTEQEIQKLEIVSPPTRVFNLIGSNAVAGRFGDLSDIECFYQTDGVWWLDCDPKYARCGVILPVRDPRQPRFITALRLFRSVRDPRPFMLRVRAERQAAA